METGELVIEKPSNFTMDRDRTNTDVMVQEMENFKFNKESIGLSKETGGKEIDHKYSGENDEFLEKKKSSIDEVNENFNTRNQDRSSFE